MKTFFPFLRGKQNELMALRELSVRIAESGRIDPIIEPVKDNPTTRISLDKFIEASMHFLFICNPMHGEFEGRPDRLYTNMIADVLMDYDNWIPTFQVHRDTTPGDFSAFINRYSQYYLSVVYQALPQNQETQNLLQRDDILHHVFIGNRVNTAYIGRIQQDRRVMVEDRFHREPRNADYVDREFYSDMNTTTGNPLSLCFGDFSIVGDQYSETGGPAYAVTAHHIHYASGPGPLDISHFISDRTETIADTSGKIIEAVKKLVNALDHLGPNNTTACDVYREIAETEMSKGLGYLKRLAIQHHLELMLDGGNLL